MIVWYLASTSSPMGFCCCHLDDTALQWEQLHAAQSITRPKVMCDCSQHDLTLPMDISTVAEVRPGQIPQHLTLVYAVCLYNWSMLTCGVCNMCMYCESKWLLCVCLSVCMHSAVRPHVRGIQSINPCVCVCCSN